MARNCPHLLAYGSCSDPTCTMNHTILTCEPCGFVVSNPGFYRSHLKGKRHRSRIAGLSVTLFCPVCKRNIGGGGWTSHMFGRPHREEAARKHVSPIVQPQEGASSESEAYCDMCRIVVPQSKWERHVASFGHKKREGYASYKAALDEAEKDKNGLMTEGDFDFGILEPNISASGVRRAAKIRLTTPSARVALISHNLVSMKDKDDNSIFTVTVEGVNRTISSITPVTIEVAFSQKHIGRYEDRLELVFEDLQLEKEFIISKCLSAVVGNKGDHEALKAKAPYIVQPRTEREPELEVVEGVPPPSTKAIPYIGKLPLALIPHHLLSTLSSGTTGEIVARIRRTYLPREFKSETYARHFKHLLWSEEFRSERDLERYDIANTTLTRYNQYYYLEVPGLAEKRPSVLIGDRILVRKADAPRGHWFAGGVHVVRDKEIGLRFHETFKGWSPTEKYNVRFKLNRLVLQRQHLAMDTAFSEDRVLFPDDEHARLSKVAECSSIKVFNRLIEKNALQLKAVNSIVHSPQGSVPFIIFGPPGTGKTITVVEAIRQLLVTSPDSRILACAPSNSAADLIASSLCAALSPEELFRFYAPSRSKNQVPDELSQYTYVRDDGSLGVPPMVRMKRYRVVVTTCVSASVVSGIGLPRGHYSYIFIDEVGQATEPETFVSIKTIADKSTNIVLSGDPKQLGPIIRSTVARVLGLEKSYLERLMEREIYDVQRGHGTTIIKLVQNFRSHEAILKFPNERFYNGDLRRCAESTVTDAYLGSQFLPAKNFPIVFHAVAGKDERESSSPSFFNIDEAIQVKHYVQALRADRRFRTTDSDIGIITPYNAQCLKIRSILKAVADGIKVGSVEEFQGQERKVIVVSTVRSNKEFVEYDLRHTLGFVASPRRFNVAITRAKSLLIVVGDPHVLSLDPLWRSFLNYVYHGGGWAGPLPTWDTEAPVSERKEDHNKYIREKAEVNMNDLARSIELLTLARKDEEDYEANVDRPWRDVE